MEEEGGLVFLVGGEGSAWGVALLRSTLKVLEAWSRSGILCILGSFVQLLTFCVGEINGMT